MNLLVVRRAIALAFLSLLAACASGQLPPLTQAQIPNKLQPASRPSAPMIQIGSGFKDPEGIAVDSAGNVYVADALHNRIVKVSPPFTGLTHGTITTISRGLDRPAGIAVDAVGNIYVANTGRNQVRRIQESGTVNVIGTGFSSPKGVAVDARGDVYVADYGNNRIAKVVPPFVGPNHGTISIVMTATAETAVSIDASGAVYGTAAIREHTSEGFQPNVFQVIPPTTPCPTGLTCLTTINKFAGFYRPRGVATDPQCTTSCDFYVADTGLGVVDQVSQGGQVLRRIGSGLRHPYGVAADKNGNIYVSDSASRSVWMIASGS